MKLIFHNVLLLILISASHTTLNSNLKENVISFLQGSQDNKHTIYDVSNKEHDNKIDKRIPKQTANVIRVNEFKNLNDLGISKTKDKASRKRYHIDSLLNYLKRRAGSSRVLSTSNSESSSRELKDWKEHWIQKKFEAANATPIRGDDVNMVAARSWGVPCGDPNQHDIPWGTCMLPMECEAEYRIYRGDYLCGWTQFVCCSLQLTTYDMYQRFDISFADSSLATDSEEKRNKGKSLKERKGRKRLMKKKKRKRERLKRKRKIKRNIKKIIKEIRKILNKSYSNGTTARKKKTKQLKAFIQHLKKQFKNDRKHVKNIHELELMKIDSALQTKLNQIRNMNQDFIKNSTFRDIVVNGTITKEGARMLVAAYPELASYLKTRRSGNRPKDYMDYDIKYGLVYY
ncbi:uncharacterized protein LOC113513384 [Galleria mellonella]|uniref:Uncharacterized protein LOC113513384 n=1 Tax=Galleria mellonella TaxID=7137 RepID=A0A6J1WGJ9_GALME|nr:uncharacterized protein LOC113513384 [Galleria mellonella]